MLDAPDFRGTRDEVIADPLAAYYRPALRTRSYLPTYSPRVSFYQSSANNHSPRHLSRRYHSLTDLVLRLITAERDSNRDHLLQIEFTLDYDRATFHVELRNFQSVPFQRFSCNVIVIEEQHTRPLSSP